MGKDRFHIDIIKFTFWYISFPCFSGSPGPPPPTPSLKAAVDRPWVSPRLATAQASP